MLKQSVQVGEDWCICTPEEQLIFYYTLKKTFAVSLPQKHFNVLKRIEIKTQLISFVLRTKVSASAHKKWVLPYNSAFAWISSKNHQEINFLLLKEEHIYLWKKKNQLCKKKNH